MAWRARRYESTPNPAIVGDDFWFTAFAAGAPFQYWGNEFQGIDFIPSGVAFFDSTPGPAFWEPQNLPDPTDPNNVLAMLWHDFEVVWDDSPHRGVTLAALAMNGGYTRNNWLAMLTPVIILGVPLFDLAFVSVLRVEQGLSPLRGSPDHAALRLRRAGLTVKQAVAVAYAAGIALAMLDVALHDLLGRTLAADLARHKRPFVVIEKDADRCSEAGERGYLYVHGNATDDEVLVGAGLAATYMPGLRLLSDRIEGVAQSRAIAFYTSFFGIGVALSLVLTGAIGAAWGWRAAFALLALGPAAAVLLVTFGLERVGQPGQGPKAFTLGDLFPVAAWRRVLAARASLGYTLGYAAHSLELLGSRSWMVAFLAFCAGFHAAAHTFPWSATAIASPRPRISR